MAAEAVISQFDKSFDKIVAMLKEIGGAALDGYELLVNHYMIAHFMLGGMLIVLACVFAYIASKSNKAATKCYKERESRLDEPFGTIMLTIFSGIGACVCVSFGIAHIYNACMAHFHVLLMLLRAVG